MEGCWVEGRRQKKLTEPVEPGLVHSEAWKQARSYQPRGRQAPVRHITSTVLRMELTGVKSVKEFYMKSVRR